ncbi:geranylgeranylglycerol-phosphate geranylgeranyltransferase [Psychroflexus planctonicus]|uniref:Ubiquinone biosynthesis protein UbiA n=1 Tax=Psychroflexus planctonicus TaxID=1526575 RepID=A0ABQ1SMA3_9FLAO|nr:geranylgeranylglycerol-phosphate geranylgeranyltransferase [Psychroflexus planctonicus]GGE41733.1 ubiquinone biosynthesis protein UbiA [Psychroflexus planctonicus]
MSPKKPNIFLKLLSLFAVVRGYNILVIVVAQYLASVFIIAPNYLSAKKIVFDVNLFLIVVSSALAIASGYIINNFYDSAKDLINRPKKTYLENMVSQQTKLSLYFILNFACIIIASSISFNAVLFFSAYIFAIWLYSHQLKRNVFIGNITASILAVVPFFAVFIYYRNFDLVIFVHALFLFLLISLRELTKDMQNIKGDFAQNYQTIPVKFGSKLAKQTASILVLMSSIPVIVLLTKFDLGYMNYYFMLSLVVLLFYLIMLWKSASKYQYVWLHNLLKFLIVLGVFCILLIDVDLVIKRFL